MPAINDGDVDDIDNLDEFSNISENVGSAQAAFFINQN
jgi:hypothetical protein